MSKLYEIRVRGGQHHDFGRALDAHALFLGCQLHLKREPDNPYDSNAIAVYVKLDGEEWKIGHVEAKKAAWFAPRFDAGAVVHLCTVTKIDKHGLNATLDLRGGWSGVEHRHGSQPGTTEAVEDDDIPF